MGYQGEKQAKNKADFPCSLQEKNENENGVMGSSRPFAQKRTYNSRERT